MHHLVYDRKSAIAALCRRMGVSRLEVFGSAARDDFDEQSSDIDFLVEFETGAAPLRDTPLRTWFGLKAELEQLFDRPVDLVSLSAIANPYLRASIEISRQTVYAA